MNHLVIVGLNKFELGMVNWLTANISAQGVRWKVEIDGWERRMVYFMSERERDSFKVQFGL